VCDWQHGFDKDTVTEIVNHGDQWEVDVAEIAPQQRLKALDIDEICGSRINNNGNKPDVRG
jgi:hypothetical protein